MNYRHCCCLQLKQYFLCHQQPEHTISMACMKKNNFRLVIQSWRWKCDDAYAIKRTFHQNKCRFAKNITINTAVCLCIELVQWYGLVVTRLCHIVLYTVWLIRYDMYPRYSQSIFGMYHDIFRTIHQIGLKPTEICDVEWSFPGVNFMI